MNENKLKIGHTGITWLNDDDFEDAIRTIAKEGFGGIELFGWTLPKIKAQGKLGLFEECGLPLWSGYFSHDVINPDRRQEQFNKIKEQGEILLSHCLLYTSIYPSASFLLPHTPCLHRCPHSTLSVQNKNPVSYTHLDVYKRQNFRCKAKKPVLA